LGICIRSLRLRIDKNHYQINVSELYVILPTTLCSI